MSNPYYIDDDNRIWIKDSIASNGTNVYYIKQTSGYIPNIDNIFDFADNFNDNSINSSKWYTSGVGVIEEKYNCAHIKATVNNGYPKFITVPSLTLSNQIIEYKVKTIGISTNSCEIGYTSYDNITLYWYLYIDSDKYINLWTRTNGVWSLQWRSVTPVIINTWYKFKFIINSNGIQFYLLKLDESVITNSESYLCDMPKTGSLYIGNRSIGDESFFDSFIIRQYYDTELVVSVVPENDYYKIIIKNNSLTELHDCQIKIQIDNLNTTSLNIYSLYKTPLKNPYYNIYNNCVMNIPHINEDIIGNHVLNIYNSTNTIGRFSDVDNSAHFNGINTRAIINNTDDLNIFNLSNFTLHIWIKQLTDYITDYCTILSKAINTNNSTNRWRLQIINNSVGFIVSDSTQIYSFVSLSNPIKINDNEWHLLTFVRNNDYLYTYKDAKYMQTMPLINIKNFTTTDNVDIGCMFTTINYDKYCNADFGEITLYTVSQDIKNILKYYDITKFKYIPTSVNIYQY